MDAFEFENRFEQMKERMPLFRLDENDIVFATSNVQNQFPIFTIFMEKNIRNCKYKFTFKLSNDLKNNVGIVKIDFFAPVGEIYDKLIEFCKSYTDRKAITDKIKKSKENISVPHKCQCCGATLKKDSDYCEFCGTGCW